MASCHRESRVDRVAQEYVRLALALGERDPDSLDFTLADSKLQRAMHQRYMTLDEIDSAAKRLLQVLAAASEDKADGKRADFLAQQVHAIRTRVAMLRGQRLPMDVEARELFATSVLPDADEEDRQRVRSQIAQMLPAAAGRRATSLAEHYADYDRHFLVPRERLPAVMRAALQACRKRTLEYVALPGGEHVDLQFVRNKPWSAFSHYQGNAHSAIAVNTDFPVTVDEALQLACHEGYPGHHVLNTLRDASLQHSSDRREAEVLLTFSPEGYVSEAMAALAAEIALPEKERLAIERDTLFPVAGLRPEEAARYVRINTLVRELDSAEPAIARDYLDGDLEFVRAQQKLADAMLMAHSEATLLYLNEYRSYMLAYTDGPRRIKRVLGCSTGSSPEEDHACAFARFVALARSEDALTPTSVERSSYAVQTRSTWYSFAYIHNLHEQEW